MDDTKTLIMLPVLSMLMFFLVLHPAPAVCQQVSIKVGKGFGAVGSDGNRIEIILENPQNKVKGLSVEICDEGNLLAATGCESIGRAEEFDCSAYENLRSGCAKIVLFSMGPLIVEGEGPVAVVSFKVSREASSGDCVRLTPALGANSKTGRSAGAVSDENNKRLDAASYPGEFCFTGESAVDESTTTSPATTTAASADSSPATTSIHPQSAHPTTIAGGTNINMDTSSVSGRIMPALDRSRLAGVDQPPEGQIQQLPGTYDGGSAGESGTVQPARGLVSTGSTTTTASGQDVTEASVPDPVKEPESSFRLTVSPPSISLNPLAVIKFSVKTTNEDVPVEGKYVWKISPRATTGSTVDENGVFTAGTHVEGFGVVETLVVKDIIHDNISATVSIIIKSRPTVSGPCDVVLNLSSVTVFPGDVIQFDAKNLGKSCKQADYDWTVNTRTGSKISSTGKYTAGENNSGCSAMDFIILKDIANSISKNAVVTVLSEEESGNKTGSLSLKNSFFDGYILISMLFLAVMVLIAVLYYLRVKKH